MKYFIGIEAHRKQQMQHTSVLFFYMHGTITAGDYEAQETEFFNGARNFNIIVRTALVTLQDVDRKVGKINCRAQRRTSLPSKSEYDVDNLDVRRHC